MKFVDYLEKTKEIATKEVEVLKKLKNFDDIEIRAAKSSLQVLIENAIGKAKRILKHYNCPIVPKRAKDAIYFLYEVGYIDEEMMETLIGAIGFRNALIHDYMEFKEEILLDILKEKKYFKIYEFLIEDVKVSDVIRKRIENFEF